MGIKKFWKELIGKDQNKEPGMLYFFYIPEKWWSWPHWKTAIKMRIYVNTQLIKIVKTNEFLEKKFEKEKEKKSESNIQ